MNEITDKAIELVNWYGCFKKIKAEIEYEARGFGEPPKFYPAGIRIGGLEEICRNVPEGMKSFVKDTLEEMCKNINKTKEENLALVKKTTIEELLRGE